MFDGETLEDELKNAKHDETELENVSSFHSPSKRPTSKTDDESRRRNEYEEDRSMEGGEPDIEKLSRVLEQQLNAEVVMAESDNYEELEKEFLEHREDPESRFQHACACVRSNKRENKLNGLRILLELERNKSIDDCVLFYYISIAYYRLFLLQESQRYCEKLLSIYQTHRQGRVLQVLLARKLSRKILVCVDGGEESDLAFNRALELYKPSDSLIIHTEVDPKVVKQYIISSTDLVSQESAIQIKATELGEKVIKRYTQILNERKIEYSTIIEAGNTKTDIIAIIDQEHVDTVILGFGEARKQGLFGRATISATSSYVYYNANCDVVIVKAKKQPL